MPIPGYATAEGTAAYSRRFASLATGHFRESQGLHLSSIGLGTYLGENDSAADQAYTAAVERAVQLGANVLDSAINYRFQRSERSIGAALQNLVARGEVTRPEVVVCTKAGFLTPDGEMPANPRQYFEQEYLAPGILRREEIVAGMHSMAPRYLENQIARSRRNLGLETIDVFYLHNPETQAPELDRDEFHRRLRAAFELLEKKASEGWIRFYGTATWNGYRRPPRSPEHLSLEAIVGLAKEAGGEGHHFRFVQLPYNLQMPEAFTHPTQTLGGKPVSLLEAAAALGVTVIASASLMQAALSRGLPPMIGEALPGLESDAHRAIQFVRSTPGIATALVGMGQAAHVEQNLRLAARPPASKEDFLRLFEREAR